MGSFIIREALRIGGERPTMHVRGRLDSHRQIGFFVALGFVRFVSESRPSSRR